jgi:hypothetical protein
MRLRGCFPALCFLCLVIIFFDACLTTAQDDVGSSTIKLVSATEPVRDVVPAAPPTRLPLEVDSQDPPPGPVSSHVHSDDAGQLNRTVAPRPIPKPLAAPTAAPITGPMAVHPRMPAGLYAIESAKNAMSQEPGPAPVQSAPRRQTIKRGGKPFQSVPTQSTVSPYLYLQGNMNTGSNLTNYFAFVRPQMDQAEASRQQQQEIQQLRTQLQKMSSVSGAPQTQFGMGGAAHYMDTAQFYRRPQQRQ